MTALPNILSLAGVVAGSAERTLVQLDVRDPRTGAAIDVAAVASAIGSNAATVLSADDDRTPLTRAIAATRALGAARLYVSILPSGAASVDITVDTLGAARELVADLGMPALTYRTDADGRHEWWESEVGEYGHERMAVVGGHRPMCQCHPQIGRAA